jgi:membrane-associated phospholipid phosphatase
LRILFLHIFLIATLFTFAQHDSVELQFHRINENIEYGYKKPKFFDLFTNIPKNYVDLGKGLTKKKNLAWVGLAVATTAVLIPPDQDLIMHAQDISSTVDLSQTHTYGNIALGIDYPTNSAALFYHFGHGNVSLLFASGFLATGLIKKDYRAIHTSIEIGESILTLGVMTQGLKRIFGRQSPHRATVDGGEWNFFPNLGEYMRNTSNFDAMPSGHMATLISTVTVISKNYPEIRWIKPLGYSMAALMGFEMMNSGVHWASDYPIGFLIGYSVATVSVNRRITKHDSTPTSSNKNKLQPNFFVSSLHGIPVYGIRAEF